MGAYIPAKTAKEALDRLCTYTSPRDREWAWWLTMRELAAVAGLALWVCHSNNSLRVALGTRCLRSWRAQMCRETLGWEAPDA